MKKKIELIRTWIKSHKSKIELTIWLLLALFLLLKSYLVTNLNSSDFLNTYKFLSPDSYDWLANGILFLQNTEISFRQPGLPLLIFILNKLNLLQLLPLFNQIALFLLIFGIYKITLLTNVGKKYAYLIVFFLSVNYFLQSLSLFILADIYAVTLLTLGVYFFLKNRPVKSSGLLGLSWLFQNFSPIIFAFFLGIQIYRNRKALNWKGLIIQVVLFIMPYCIYPIYKYFTISDGFYSSVTQFGLLIPNFNSVLYYLINSLTVYGIACFVLVVYLIFYAKSDFFRQSNVKILIVGLLISLGFWTILYDWNDRRFLVYTFPFFYPILALVIKRLILERSILQKAIIVIIFIYPSIFSTANPLFGNIIPLSLSEKIVFNLEAINNIGQNPAKVEVKRVNEKGVQIFGNIHPLFAELYYKRGENRFGTQTTFSEYSKIIENSKVEIQNNNRICIENDQVISNYEFNSVLLIKTGKSLQTVAMEKC